MKKLPYSRSDRIKKLLHREVAQIILKLKDPRANFITITEVEVSEDLRNAKIYYMVTKEENVEETKNMFEAAKGYIKSQIAQKLNLKKAIEVDFIYDKFLEKAQRVIFLLDKIKDEENK